MPANTIPKRTDRVIADAWNSYSGKRSAGGNDTICCTKAKEALLHVFGVLSSVVPIPEDWWFDEVFQNYDPDGVGTLDRECFRDIVIQYYEFHERKGTKSTVADMNICSEVSKSSKNNLAFKPDIVYPHNTDKIWLEYTFLESTGKGSFGSVDIVTKKSTQQKRACKSIVINSNMEWELVRTEIDLIQQLNHPNILRLHETYQSGNVVYIITEYCAGGQLFDKISKHQMDGECLTEDKVARWIRQIISALAYIHMLGIAHRDIKPENLLLLDHTENSLIKLIDFGLSSSMEKIRASQKLVEKKKTSFSSLTASWNKLRTKMGSPANEQKYVMQRAGTLHYMAPEMIKGYYDQQCDIFPMGILMYQLLTGNHPFFVPGVDTERSIRQKIMTKEVRCYGGIWESISKEAKDLCLKMLIKNPKRRITASEAMAHPWFTTCGQTESSVVKTDFKSDLTFSVFEGLKEWRGMSALKQAVLHLLASRLSEDEISDMRYQFEKLDVSQSGMVALEDLKKVAFTAGLITSDDSDEDLKRIINSLDFGGHGCIGYNEFISAILMKRRTIDDMELRRIFDQFDKKQNGYLTLAELKLLMNSSTNVPSYILEMVSDEEGEISFFQFLEYMRKDDLKDFRNDFRGA